MQDGWATWNETIFDNDKCYHNHIWKAKEQYTQTVSWIECTIILMVSVLPFKWLQILN